MNNTDREPIIGCFKDLKLRRMEWLWPNRIPVGKLSLLVGVGGVGKSFLSLYMAAQVSTGRPWIDEPQLKSEGSRKPGDVFILTTEDELDDTVGVRLTAAGANLSRIHYIQAVKTKDGIQGLNNLTTDVDILIKAIRQVPTTKLIIIDPISAYMEGKNENKNAEVREYLNPLIRLAAVGKLAIVGISHLNKNQDMSAANRVLGSTGFINATRAAWLVHQDKNDSDRKLFVHMKGNLGVKPTGLAYKLMSQSVQTETGLEGSAYCAFEPDLLYITAEDLLGSDVKEQGRPKKQDDASDWLYEYLADGPKPAFQVIHDAGIAQYGERTLRAAKKKLKIQSYKMVDEAGAPHWEWALAE